MLSALLLSIAQLLGGLVLVAAIVVAAYAAREFHREGRARVARAVEREAQNR